MTKSTTADPEQYELYQFAEDLPSPLWDDICALNPDKVRQRAQVGWQDGYVVPFLGRDYFVRPDSRRIDGTGSRPVSFQAGLILLDYLIHAKDEGLSGRMVTSRELNGGDLFFQGPHALMTAPVIDRFKRDAAGMVEAAKRWGATPAQGGDASFRLLALPKILLMYTLHEEDDEFPAQLTITFDAYTDRHLMLDAIWALINLLSGRLGRL
jgi:hypothetical protein